MLHGHALTWTTWWPSVRAGLIMVVLFVAAIWLTREFAAPIQAVLTSYAVLGIAVFFVSTVVAVLLPMLSNLPLIPAFVLVWGPWWTALALLAGWVVGAALSFLLARHARSVVLQRFPVVHRHVNIDRFIHPQHRMWSLILLRMTFPVDLLSYALGLFSERTTLQENVLATVIGAAPFAILFALLPTLSGKSQLVIFSASMLIFACYAYWILERPPRAS